MSLKDPQNKQLLNDFIAEHAPLVGDQIRALKATGKIPKSVEESDLHLHGIHGLISALHKYSPEIANRLGGEGNAFVKYAKPYIRGKILDHVASHDEIPKHIRQRAKNLALLEQQGTSSPPKEDKLKD